MCQLVSIGLGVALAARLRAPVFGLLIAGVWLASFPFQGGTATWVVGRVDSLCLPFLLGSALAGAAGRPGAGALACLGAAATKEIGFAAPLWFVFAALGAGRPKALRSAVWPLVTGALVFGFRRFAIGDWIGGYPKLGPGPELADWLRGAFELLALGGALGPLLVVALLLSAVFARERLRPALALVACGGVALAVLLPLVAGGGIAPEHRRWWLIPDAIFGLALVVALPPAGRIASAPGRLLVWTASTVVLILVAVFRVPRAEADVAEWVLAGQLCEEHAGRVRASVAEHAPSSLPVLDPGVQRTTPSGAAYVFHWGFAERFQAPFESTPRPIWPLRRIFEPSGPVRSLGTVPLKGLAWPEAELLPGVEALPVRLIAGGPAGAPSSSEREVQRFELNADLIGRRDGSAPRIDVFGEFNDQRLEFLLHTAIGQEVGIWRGPLETAPRPLGNGEAQGVRDLTPAISLPLLDVLESREGVALAVTLVQVADLGHQRAYLELRAVANAAQDNRPSAVSRWIELTWDEDFRRALLP